MGGKQGRASKGIHWHVDPGVRIRYLADDKRETIGKFELTRADGTTTIYASRGAPSVGAWRTMDCIDCHNRPSHIYRTPDDELDCAMAEGRIDPALPFVHREGLKALQGSYASRAEGRSRIAEALQSFYAKEHTDVDRTRLEAASKGCFRCHDCEHVSAKGATISQDCDTCHTVLAMEEANPEVLKTLQP